jgi:cation transport ATPase
MKKNTYRLENIDCAACALKIEDKLNNTLGVENASLNFMLLKLYVTFDETTLSDEEIEEIIHKALSGVKITEKNNQKFEDTYIEESKPIFGRFLLNRRKK